jgi:hypothetical protein
MKRKWLAVGIILLFIGMACVPGITVKISGTLEKESFDYKNSINNELGEKTVYRLCHIKSGEVRHKNFNGWFSCIPINHPKYGICHFGIGSFVLDLQRDYFTGDNETTLEIMNILFKKTYIDNNITIRVSLFIGYYQPTGDLSSGILSGFALSIQIYPINNSSRDEGINMKS